MTNLLNLQNKKISQELSIKLLEYLALAKTVQEFRIDTTLKIPGELVLHDDENLQIIGNKNDSYLDALYIFPHIGIKLPLSFKDQLNLENWEQVIDAMYVNRDAGTRFIANRLIDDLANKRNKFNYAVVIFHINRNVIDANRITTEEQMPQTPYKGISLWKEGIDKEAISKELLDKPFTTLREFAKKLNPKIVIYPHTYDTYSGGSKGSNQHDIHNGKRPTSMIVQKYKFDKNAYGKYGDPEHKADFNFIESELIVKIETIFKNNLSKIKDLNKEVQLTVDFPYVSPLEFPALLYKDLKVTQVIVEFRKDLFKKGWEEVYRCIVDMGNL